MRVGCVQYFLKHKLFILDNEQSNTQQIEHIFAYVIWKKQHRHYDYYGSSAIVCQNENEMTNSFILIPVQRIAYRCAHLQMKTNFDDLDETIFVASPLPIRHSI